MQAHVGRFAAALERYDVPVVLDQQNVEFETSRMVSRLAPNPAMRLRFRFDALKARAFERRLIGRVRLTVAVSAADAAVFRSLAPGAAVVVRPSGADLRTRDFVDHSRARADRLVMTGTLGYLPNLDGANWMFDRILPRLLARRPSIRLSLVGAAAPPSLQGREGVDVAGRVPDVRPYLHAADLFVAPLRAGGGTRLKLLEAFAVGLPVVATSVAAAGLDVADGVHLRIADEAEAFARAVLELLDDVQARSRLAHAARRLVESRYDWRTIARDYERDLLALVASGPRHPNEPAKERALDRRPDRPEECQVHDSGRDEAQQPVEA
jgi:glycosyltransferase involved in cell wall biosynthesis